jgi:hypothetical protein
MSTIMLNVHFLSMDATNEGMIRVTLETRCVYSLLKSDPDRKMDA